MLAIVKSAKSVRASLKYNEQKVEQRQARLLDAHNFWQEKEELTPRDKWQRFNDLSTLNQRSQKHSVHITLNFPTKDDLSDRKMTEIATAFMERIGFAEQPWLTYRHLDAGHPHMHIVSTNIRPDGSRIPNDLRSPAHLKQICFTMEEEYRLAPAIQMPELFEEKKAPSRKQNYGGEARITSGETRVTYGDVGITSGEAGITCGETRVTYGKAPTKTEIARVLEHVVNQYAYSDLESYNAILSQYHVRADRGSENSPMYSNKGLYYRVVDEKGKKIGAPIKASAFDQPVKLPQLETMFRLNQAKLQQESQFLRNRIDSCVWFAGKPCSLGILKEDMMRENIDIVIDGRHGFFYIDHHAKIAIRDTDLGEQYSASAILRRTGIEQDIRQLANKNRFRLTIGEQRVLSQPDGKNSSKR